MQIESEEEDSEAEDPAAEDSEAEDIDALHSAAFTYAEDSVAEDSDAEDIYALHNACFKGTEDSGGRKAWCGTALPEGRQDRPVVLKGIPISESAHCDGGAVFNGALTAAVPAPPSGCQQPHQLLT